MATKSHVYFGVFDFGDDPGVVSGIMGMEPTKAWVKGEPVAPSGAIRTHSRWSLESGLDKEEPFEAHISALLAKLERKRTEIRRVAERFPARIGVAQYFDEANPGFRLEAEIVQRIAGLGLAIDFDQYCLPEAHES